MEREKSCPGRLAGVLVPLVLAVACAPPAPSAYSLAGGRAHRVSGLRPLIEVTGDLLPLCHSLQLGLLPGADRHGKGTARVASGGMGTGGSGADGPC